MLRCLADAAVSHGLPEVLEADELTAAARAISSSVPIDTATAVEATALLDNPDASSGVLTECSRSSVSLPHASRYGTLAALPRFCSRAVPSQWGNPTAGWLAPLPPTTPPRHPADLTGFRPNVNSGIDQLRKSNSLSHQARHLPATFAQPAFDPVVESAGSPTHGRQRRSRATFLRRMHAGQSQHLYPSPPFVWIVGCLQLWPSALISFPESVPAAVSLRRSLGALVMGGRPLTALAAGALYALLLALPGSPVRARKTSRCPEDVDGALSAS